MSAAIVGPDYRGAIGPTSRIAAVSNLEVFSSSSEQHLWTIFGILHVHHYPYQHRSRKMLISILVILLKKSTVSEILRCSTRVAKTQKLVLRSRIAWYVPASQGSRCDIASGHLTYWIINTCVLCLNVCTVVQTAERESKVYVDCCFGPTYCLIVRLSFRFTGVWVASEEGCVTSGGFGGVYAPSDCCPKHFCPYYDTFTSVDWWNLRCIWSRERSELVWQLSVI